MDSGAQLALRNASGLPRWPDTPTRVDQVRSLERLSELGPVLLVQVESLACLDWTLSVSVDERGVRECLHIAGWRVYRLPDSDYLGWERLGRHVAEVAHCIASPGRHRRASVARLAAGLWQGVPKISPPGWRLAQEVLKDETATLCAAVWHR